MSIAYAKTTDAQRRQWHAEVYALRRIALDVPHDTHTSPCDLKGDWYDERLVAEVEARLRHRLAEQAKRCAADTAAHNAIRFAEAAAWRDRHYGTPLKDAAE